MLDKERKLDQKTWAFVHAKLSVPRYHITADHPILARPDKVVSEIELMSYKHELQLAGYENIQVEKI